MGSKSEKSPRKVTGEARSKLLEKLSRRVYRSHRNANQASQTWLKSVYRAGKALRRAKKVLGGRGKWTKWLSMQREYAKKRGSDFSHRTARSYMQVVKLWNEPNVKKAREAGEITSINALLNAAKPWKNKDWVPTEGFKPKDVSEADSLRIEIRQMFAKDLKENYRIEEMDILHTHYYEIAGILRDEVVKRTRESEHNRREDRYYHDELPEPERDDEEDRLREQEWKRLSLRIQQVNPDEQEQMSTDK